MARGVRTESDPDKAALRRAVLLHACTLCLAAPSEPCVALTGASKGKVVDHFHKARQDKGHAKWIREKVIARQDAEMVALEEEFSALEKIIARANRLRVLRDRLVNLAGEVVAIERSAATTPGQHQIPPDGEETVEELRSELLALIARLDGVDAITEVRSRVEDLIVRVENVESRIADSRT